MSLTEEERRKIYEEEKARIEAQKEIKKGKGRSGCLIVLAVLFGLFLLIIMFSRSKDEYNYKTTPSKTNPKILLKINKVTYEHGYFKVVGVAENIGEASAFSPTINLEIYDSSGKTLLAQDSTWPAGHYLKKFAPGSSAAFEIIESVPGEPDRVRWQLSVKDYPYEVKR